MLRLLASESHALLKTVPREPLYVVKRRFQERKKCNLYTLTTLALLKLIFLWREDRPLEFAFIIAMGPMLNLFAASGRYNAQSVLMYLHSAGLFFVHSVDFCDPCASVYLPHAWLITPWKVYPMRIAEDFSTSCREYNCGSFDTAYSLVNTIPRCNCKTTRLERHIARSQLLLFVWIWLVVSEYISIWPKSYN